MATSRVTQKSVLTKFRSNIIGMIHLLANPGTPGFQGSVQGIIARAEREAQIYKMAGVDSVLIENMHDIPYQHSGDVGPEVVSMMTSAAVRVRKAFDSGPVGVQILAGANNQALAVALATGLDYIRAEGFVFSHVADEGLMHACAGPLLRYRRHIGAENVAVFTDIKKKHSAHSITADVDIMETARAAQFFRSDGVIVTGTSTGAAVSTTELNDVQKAVSIPVLVGSGVTIQNYQEYKSATGLIIGSYFKKGHHWSEEIDETVLADFMDMVRSHEQ
ncbi:YSMU-like protein [Mya arenaria]|uniref:YSMU-like protein n=1 Tax=Mya arenaria TaxID=6604 RepID=A0ABY7END7_MYAAR|nr:uncharacterized protein F13E9.13, mitochondrial-like [Mya arenaria]WAR11512.1 YSMU-like protein [Mya arenaria]